MKVVVREYEREIDYPWLGKDENGNVYCFYGKGCGVRVYAANKNSPVAVKDVSMKPFNKFVGFVVLKNEPGVTEESDITMLQFPWLGLSSNGTIRLFDRWRGGLCLQRSAWGEVGSYNPYTNMEYFKPFMGEVILSNN